MKRQAIIVTPAQLRILSDKLEQEIRDTNKEIGISTRNPITTPILTTIINKDDSSDGWRFEP